MTSWLWVIGLIRKKITDMGNDSGKFKWKNKKFVRNI